MKNPMTKFAAAAAVAVACIIGVLLWRGTSSGMTLADVLATIEEVTAYSYRVNTVLTGSKGTEERTSHILVSKDHGIKIVETTDSDDPESRPGEMYVLPQQNAMVFVSHEDRFYTRIEFNEDSELKDYREQNNDPNIIVKNFLRCQYTRLGLSDIDGVEVEGFRTTDPNYGGGFAAVSDFMGTTEKISAELWVDVKTLLPVRVIEDSYRKYSPDETLHFYEISFDFEWNVVVHPNDFNPVKPEGYTSIGDTEELVVPDFDEETAIQGLRLFVSLAGTYPVDLNSMQAESKKLIGIEGSSDFEKYSDDEATAKAGQLILLGVPRFFYQELVGDNRDPTYYGQTVEPGEAEKVLLRWRLDDGLYRVIFGDLSARTISAKELAELEHY